MSRAEELAHKLAGLLCAPCSYDSQSLNDAVCILHEYGAAVRARDAEICRKESAFLKSDGDGASGGCDLCAAAISKEPMP